MSDLSFNRDRLIRNFIKETGLQLTKEQFLNNFILEQPNKPLAINQRKNTYLKVIPKLDSIYFGIKTIWYNRIHIKELGRIEVTRTTEQKISELLPQINNKYGLKLSNYDIIDFDLLPNQIGTFPIVLPINKDSLMFYDGVFIPTDDNLVPPTEIAWPQGMLVYTYCNGFDRMGLISNGDGTNTLITIEHNCPECGYDPDNMVYLIIDGGDADTVYSESWQVAGTPGAL